MTTLTYSTPGISCAHCVTAITTEVGRIDGVSEIDVDLVAKSVTVTGEHLDDGAVRDAIDEAGYDADPS
jgi:copper chaperone